MHSKTTWPSKLYAPAAQLTDRLGIFVSVAAETVNPVVTKYRCWKAPAALTAFDNASTATEITEMFCDSVDACCDSCDSFWLKTDACCDSTDN